MNTEIQTTVTVLADRLPEAKAELNRLLKKAARYGAPLSLEVGEARFEAQEIVDWDGDSRRVNTKVVDIHIVGEKFAIGNHEFLARIELGKGGNIVDTRPGVTDLAERFRHADGFCQHCNKKRDRKDVFVVRDLDTNEQVQVGRTCLREYLGIDPAQVMARFRFYREFGGNGGGYGGFGSFSQSLEGLLTLTATCIRLFGWCSKGQAATDERLTPTLSYIALCLYQTGRPTADEVALRHRIREAKSEDDKATALATIAWVRNELAPRAKSDYEHNLATLCAEDFIIDQKRVGLVISAVAAYHRAKELEIRRTKERQSAANSQHIGKVGERLRGLRVRQTMARVVGGSNFGECVLVKFLTEDGNILTWFTGKGTGLQNGESTVIDGTVKRHQEYQGIQETQMTRVSIRGA